MSRLNINELSLTENERNVSSRDFEMERKNRLVDLAENVSTIQTELETARNRYYDARFGRSTDQQDFADELKRQLSGIRDKLNTSIEGVISEVNSFRHEVLSNDKLIGEQDKKILSLRETISNQINKIDNSKQRLLNDKIRNKLYSDKKVFSKEHMFTMFALIVSLTIFFTIYKNN
jgi:hypothetical protein